MQDETFTEYETNKISTWAYKVSVQYTPATIEDIDQNARWYRTLRGYVVSVHRAKVTRWSLDWDESIHTPAHVESFVVTFQCGARAWIGNSNEIDCLIVGHKGYLHGLAVWKKYGKVRGGGVGWFRTQKNSRGGRLNVDRAPKCCAAELYARASGKSWPSGCI